MKTARMPCAMLWASLSLCLSLSVSLLGSSFLSFFLSFFAFVVAVSSLLGCVPDPSSGKCGMAGVFSLRPAFSSSVTCLLCLINKQMQREREATHTHRHTQTDRQRHTHTRTHRSSTIQQAHGHSRELGTWPVALPFSFQLMGEVTGKSTGAVEEEKQVVEKEAKRNETKREGKQRSGRS